MKRYSCRNKERLVLVLILCIVAVFFMTGFSNNEPKGEEKNIIIVTVEEGDSLWKIAKQHMKKDQDIRNVIYDIREANQLLGKEISLHPGQQLKVPCRVAINETK
jgi:hypothetical protein